MSNKDLIVIEGTATYERILAEIREFEIDEALLQVADFLKIYPDFARAHNDLAVMYYQTGNPLKALAHYEKAHKLEPSNVTYRKNLADFYFVELEWTREAINTYLDILKDNPFDIEALNALGTISMQLGRKEQARKYFSRTLQIDSDNDDARQALQQLPSPPPGATNARQIPQHHSGTCRNMEQPEPFLSDSPSQSFFAAAESESPRSPEELYREAISLASDGQLPDSIRLLEKLVSVDPGNALAHNDLGVLYQKTGEPQKSRHQHEEAVRLQPANELFQKNLADLLYIECNAFEEALKLYVDLLAKAPQDIEILKALASVCRTLGNHSDARFFLDRALALQPWDCEAQEMVKVLEGAGEAGDTQ